MAWNGLFGSTVTTISHPGWDFSLNAKAELLMGYRIWSGSVGDVFGDRWVWFAGPLKGYGEVQIRRAVAGECARRRPRTRSYLALGALAQSRECRDRPAAGAHRTRVARWLGVPGRFRDTPPRALGHRRKGADSSPGCVSRSGPPFRFRWSRGRRGKTHGIRAAHVGCDSAVERPGIRERPLEGDLRYLPVEELWHRVDHLVARRKRLRKTAKR